MDVPGISQGSIPARAGEPLRICRRSHALEVYPRPCGGTHDRVHGTSGNDGLSPPVRGNRDHAALLQVQVRSIPARAGEPYHQRGLGLSPWVYPRPCGGTLNLLAFTRTSGGLSPPVRGNLCYRLRRFGPGGSIPARAGEPLSTSSIHTRRPVYPRPCGGTHHHHQQDLYREGLSPPVRGNQDLMPSLFGSKGSIPARAGEPDWFCCRVEPSKVYPRPCGGTYTLVQASSNNQGLSPPVRGNLYGLLPVCRTSGSIPARAGEPIALALFWRVPRVYPRPCGGTCHLSSFLPRYLGLSPPVRGNPRYGRSPCCLSRSIPARAGEPILLDHCRPDGGVYPRPCGGTQILPDAGDIGKGLSPPVRGNLQHLFR